MTKTLELNIRPLQAVKPLLTGPALYFNPVTGVTVEAYSDGKRLYVLENGLYVPLGYSQHAWTGTVLNLAPGDQLQITLTFGYTGPAVTGAQAYFGWGTFGALGTWNPIQEQKYSTFNINANQTATPATITQSYTFTIPSTVSAGKYDALVYVQGGSPSLTETDYGVNQCLNIIGVTPVITSLDLASIKDVTTGKSSP
jgi:hypothetical protein